eukprot:301079-Rhodomonas_salina.2
MCTLSSIDGSHVAAQPVSNARSSRVCSKSLPPLTSTVRMSAFTEMQLETLKISSTHPKSARLLLLTGSMTFTSTRSGRTAFAHRLFTTTPRGARGMSAGLQFSMRTARTT